MRIWPTSCADAAAAGPTPAASCTGVVRRRLARAGGFGSFGGIGWYARYMLLRPASAALRPLLDRALR